MLEILLFLVLVSAQLWPDYKDAEFEEIREDALDASFTDEIDWSTYSSVRCGLTGDNRFESVKVLSWFSFQLSVLDNKCQTSKKDLLKL